MLTLEGGESSSPRNSNVSSLDDSTTSIADSMMEIAIRARELFDGRGPGVVGYIVEKTADKGSKKGLDRLRE